MPEILHLDFETRSTVNLGTAGADIYARHPSTDILCTGFAFDDNDVCVTMFRDIPKPAMVDHVFKGKTVIAHNAFFEWLIWNYVYCRDYDLPKLKIDQLQCTMVMGYAMGLPGKLEKLAPAIGISEIKDAKGHRIMQQISQPKELEPLSWFEPETHPEKFTALYKYCAQDVNVERECHKRLRKLSPYETNLWRLDHKINQRGIPVDINSAKKAMAIIELEEKRLNNEMRKITDGIVVTCNAVGRLADYLRFEGVDVKGVAKNDIIEWLDEDIPTHCRRALLLRQEFAKASTKKLKALLESVGEDGRIRGALQFNGAQATARWAGRKLQVQNFPRSTIPQENIENIFEILERTNGY